MTDVHLHILTLFTEALACAGPAEQAAYLDRACGDQPQARARVEALLRAHRQAGPFLGGAPTPVTAATVADPPPGEPPGATGTARRPARWSRLGSRSCSSATRSWPA